ncbi:CHS1 [Mytilus coruscus]|uniref:CHS1 n=1 Tax=Mytilus coruscus TaxID=42192 RepID=A0A6J8DQY2_MYTCO|nr:CHS1 [Mytilus coruscus]
MLQQGWEIDYAASADAFTFAPQTFEEFSCRGDDGHRFAHIQKGVDVSGSWFAVLPYGTIHFITLTVYYICTIFILCHGVPEKKTEDDTIAETESEIPLIQQAPPILIKCFAEFRRFGISERKNREAISKVIGEQESSSKAIIKQNQVFYHPIGATPKPRTETRRPTARQDPDVGSQKNTLD